MLRFLLYRVYTVFPLALSACTPLIVPLDNVPQTIASAKVVAPHTGVLKFATIQPPPERQVGVDVYSIRALRDAINTHTELRAELVGEGAGLPMADEQLAEIPVILLLDPPQENEWKSLCHYLLEGGFFIGFKREAKVVGEALVAQGIEDFHTVQLTEDHPLYTALFDLQNEPVAGDQDRVPLLTGYFIHDRLAGVIPESPLWSASKEYRDQAGLPARIKLTINLMAYALQEEGSQTWKRQHPEGTGSPDTVPSIKK